MKFKVSILLVIFSVSSILFSADLFDSKIESKSINLSKQEQFKLDSYLNNDTYKEISLVKSTSAIDLLSLSKIRFTDSDKREYLFEKVNNKGDIDYSLWYGVCGDSDITLVFNDGIITGTIALKSKIYQIAHLSGETYILALLDNGNFCEEKNEEYNTSSISEADQIVSSLKSRTTATISVLFAYTDDVVAVHGTSGIQSMIQTAESEANQSFSNSSANVEFDVVHMVEINYNESGNAADDVSWFANNSTIQNLRNQYGADVCMLVVDYTNSYGRAYNINVPSSQAYAVIRDDALIGRYTPAHELGHLIGARHNIEQDPRTGPYMANHGFIEPVWPQKASWMTIMGVNDLKYNPNGTRLKQWSRPGTYGNTLNADVANVLNNYASRVADFRNDPLSVTITSIGNDKYEANVSGGSENYTSYKWWSRKDDGIVPKVETKAPPPGQWIYNPSWDDLSIITCSVYWAFSLKCEVTDSDGNTATDIYSEPADKNHPYYSQKKSVKVSSIKPKKISLNNNSPNPFNPTTKIRFGVPNTQRVTINVYSIKGKKIRTLMKETVDAGYYSIGWDATNDFGEKVSSGLYIYRMKTNSKVITKKMLFTK